MIKKLLNYFKRRRYRKLKRQLNSVYGMMATRKDCIYCDTDSIKVVK